MDKDVRIAELERLLEEKTFQAQEWGFQLKEAREELERIKPLYEKFYRNPLFWFWRPIDEEFEGGMLMRCIGPPPAKSVTCGKLFWLDDSKKPGIHMKHIHATATETSAWDYIKVRWLRFLIAKPGD